jgi:MoxR-like ATPase
VPINKHAHAEILSIIDDMNSKFIARKVAINGMVTGALAGQHILMLGVPGLAKSEFARYFVSCLGLGNKFSDEQFHAQTTQSELFGGVDFETLVTKNVFRKVRVNNFCDAEAVNLDEIFKGSKASLNTMLRFLNEGVLKDENTGKLTKLPLKLVMASSNEIPSPDDGLGALFDRFLYKIYLRKISNRADLMLLLELDGDVFTHNPIITVDIDSIRADVKGVRLTDATMNTYGNLFDEVNKTNIFISDRTWRKSASVVKAAAWLAGRDETLPEDLFVLGNVLWTNPDDIPVIERLLAQVCFPQLTELYDIIDKCNRLLEPTDRIKTDSDGSAPKGHQIPREFIDYRDSKSASRQIPSQQAQGVAQSVNRALKDACVAIKHKLGSVPPTCDVSNITRSYELINEQRLANVRALSELNGV